MVHLPSHHSVSFIHCVPALIHINTQNNRIYSPYITLYNIQIIALTISQFYVINWIQYRFSYPSKMHLFEISEIQLIFH